MFNNHLKNTYRVCGAGNRCCIEIFLKTYYHCQAIKLMAKKNKTPPNFRPWQPINTQVPELSGFGVSNEWFEWNEQG